MSDLPQDISHDQYAVRLKKLQDMRAAGFDPFHANFAPTHFSADAMKLYVEGQDNAVAVKVAGRLVVFRDMGKSQFVKILDQQGQIQLYVKKDVVGEEAYASFKKLDFATSSAPRARFSKPRPAKSLSASRNTFSCPRPCARCPRNGTA